MPNRILAVAVAERNLQHIIRRPSDLKELRRVKVRPYLRGLVNGLNRRGHQLGKDYIIVFRQRKVGDLDAGTFAAPDLNPFVIYCMSTNVVAAARTHAAAAQPIVGVVSEPTLEGFDTVTNICGISARRSQTAGDCFRRFMSAVPTIQEMKVLVRNGYGPSDRARNLVVAAAAAWLPPVTVTQLNAQTVALLEAALDGLPQRDPDRDVDALTGVLVTPVDVFLGHAQDIIDIVQGEKKLPAFFPVPDWVKPDESSAFGAYGVSQRRCGQLMAERVDAIWKNGNTVPGGIFARWVYAPDAAFEFVVSAAAAKDLNIELYPSIPTL